MKETRSPCFDAIRCCQRTLRQGESGYLVPAPMIAEQDAVSYGFWNECYYTRRVVQRITMVCGRCGGFLDTVEEMPRGCSARLAR